LAWSKEAQQHQLVKQFNNQLSEQSKELVLLNNSNYTRAKDQSAQQQQQENFALGKYICNFHDHLHFPQPSAFSTIICIFHNQLFLRNCRHSRTKSHNYSQLFNVELHQFSYPVGRKGPGISESL